jgi:hypothetical protein
VVDVGIGPPSKQDEVSEEEALLRHELLLLVQKCMPLNKNSPYASFLPGFTALRLFLVQQTRSSRELDLLKSILVTYASYKTGSRSETDIAALTARDFMLLSKQHDNSTQRHQLLNTLSKHLSHSGSAFRDMSTSNPNDSLQGILQLSDPVHPTPKHPDDTLLHANLLNTFSMVSNGQDCPGPSPSGFSNLHNIVGSPAVGSHGQFVALDYSPTLQPISSQREGSVTDLAPLGMSASPISDMLRSNGSSHFRESL